jgi:hypothetical protein
MDSATFFLLWFADLQLAVQGNVIQHNIEAAITIFKGRANAGPKILALVLVNSVNGQSFAGHSCFLLQRIETLDALGAVSVFRLTPLSQREAGIYYSGFNP